MQDESRQTVYFKLVAEAEARRRDEGREGREEIGMEGTEEGLRGPASPHSSTCTILLLSGSFTYFSHSLASASTSPLK